jgi:phage replication O-like protein O
MTTESPRLRETPAPSTSKTLLRHLLDAALDSTLTLNEWRVFAVMLRQTLGFGKRADPLTDGRIAQLAHIRKDRIKPAINGIVDKKLFASQPHAWLDHTYTIPAEFFDDTPTARFFAPSVPFNGSDSPPAGEIPHSAGTYRVIPLQSANPTDDRHIEPTAILCPESIDTATYAALLPALHKLPNTQAVDVLALVAAAILDGSVKTTPTRLGFGLIKAAQNGTLNTAPLRTTPTPSPATFNLQAHQAAHDQAHFHWMASQLSEPPDTNKPQFPTAHSVRVLNATAACSILADFQA